MLTKIKTYLNGLNKWKVFILAAIIIGGLVAYIFFREAVTITFEEVIIIWLILVFMELSDINKSLEKIANKE